MIENTVQNASEPPLLSADRPPEVTRTATLGSREEGGDLQLRRPNFWQRFARHRLALVALMIIIAFALVGAFATVITPYDPYAQNFDPTALPSAAHWVGTDDLGRDELSRLILGARISLGISAGATLMAVCIGLLVGSIAGYSGGQVDNLLMRLVDLVLAFPALFLILIVAVTTGVNVLTIILLIGAFNWMFLARLTRAEFLQIKELDYVQAARALGVPTGRIIWRHVLPNALGPIIVSATFILAGAMYIEAVLDFLGFGLSPDIPSWGNLLTSAENDFYTAPLLAVVPGVLLTLAILCMNFIGDGLRDALDPRHVR
jgi:peptide/nickel transport system permease protein